jgi:hypothetical protein
MADGRHDRTPLEGIGSRVEEKGGAISARKRSHAFIDRREKDAMNDVIEKSGNGRFAAPTERARSW